MKRILLAAAVVFAAVLVPGTAAGTAQRGFDNDYSGSVKSGDKNYFGFDKEGKTATNFSSFLHYGGPCNGDLLEYQSTDELKIKHKRFRGTVTGGSVGEYTFKLRGRLRPGGKAKGRIKATYVTSKKETCQGPEARWTAAKDA